MRCMITYVSSLLALLEKPLFFYRRSELRKINRPHRCHCEFEDMLMDPNYVLPKRIFIALLNSSIASAAY